MENLGIKERHVVTSQATSDISLLAAKNAINAAGIDPEEIYCIILASPTPDRIAPANQISLKENIPSKKWGELENIIRCIIQTEYINGSVLKLTGGAEL